MESGTPLSLPPCDLPILSLAKIKLDKPAYRRLVKKVARVVEIMPLFRLQTLGREQAEFLYPNRIIDGGIELFPGACFAFVSSI